MSVNSNDLLPTRWTLIQRLKNLDDEEGWRQFFDRYWNLLLSVALKSGLSHAEAEDVVQETIISVSKSIEKFKADPAKGSFKAWLLVITRYRIIDQLRKRPHELVGFSNDPDSNSTAVEQRLPDPSGNFLDGIWEEEWHNHLISTALEKLKPQVSAQHFQIFLLYVVKKHPPEKVANVLQITTDQVYLIKNRVMPLFDEALRSLETIDL